MYKQDTCQAFAGVPVHSSCLCCQCLGALTSCPATAAPLPRRLLLSCTCGGGQISSFKSSETEAKIFIESTCQMLCSYWKHPEWGKLSFSWDEMSLEPKIFFKGNLEKTQSYVLTTTLLIYLPYKAVRLLSSCPHFE